MNAHLQPTENGDNSSPILRPLSHYGPVVACRFYKEFVLASNGPNLKIYRYLEDELVLTKRIFKENKIHGIAISHDLTRFALYGSRSFTVVYGEKELFDEKFDHLQLGVNDWIKSMEFSYDDKVVYLLTAHNVVFTVDLGTLKIIDEKSFKEKSILYSGSIQVLSQEKVLIAAGTISGGVFVWDLFENKLIRNLVGHEGAIFDVKISNDGNYCASCSDDRSVKIWDLSTGSNLATGWGHNSRIWNLCWYDNNKKIFSQSEDCTSRSWIYHEDNDLLYCEAVYETNLGKHIWCGDVNDDFKIAVTGGADGRLMLINLKSLEPSLNPSFQNNCWKKQFSMDVISELTKVEIEKNEIFKNYVDLNNNSIVCITSKGKVFILKDNYSKWEFLYQDLLYDNYSLTNYFKEENLVTFTSSKGTISALKFDDNSGLSKKVTIKINNLKGKITNVLTTKKNDENFLMFMESPNPKDGFMLIEANFELTTEPIITSLGKPETLFVLTCLAYDITNNWLLVGSRHTTFVLYDLDTGKMLNVWKKFCPGDTITSMSIIDSSYGKVILMMTVRDGLYMYLEIRKDPVGNILTKIIQNNRIQRGFLEGGFLNHKKELILYGFKSHTFFLWNETRQFEIFKEICGGAHRIWNFVINDCANDNYKFIYNKSAHLVIRNTGNAIFKDNCLDNGTHGREIRNVTILSNYTRKNGGKLFISGAEDTCVRLSEILPNGEVNNFWSLRRHVSGLQKTKFIKSEKDEKVFYCITTAAREEFFLWEIIDHPILGPLINCYATLEPSSAEPDLRIMDFDTLPIYNSKQELQGYLILNVYSDSSIKIFEFNLNKRRFELLIEDRYTTCCLWDTRFILKNGKLFVMVGATDGYISIWDITFEISDIRKENIQCLQKLLIRQQIHQSGIKTHTLIQHPYDYNILDLVTGGDDNALVNTRLVFSEISNNITLEIKSFKENAASSTITSSTLIPSYKNGKYAKIIVTSVDQRLRVWRIDYHLDSTSNDGELVCEDCAYTTVADTGCSDVCLIEDKQNINSKCIALIGGAGLSCWEITS
ncbi:hypothetical protein PACTADRAFT_66284 [Pachysolen tannophilus NRRL Y-2460]|uniref:Uncharacterized protein n=1 Tax=Pachysolen tannophilus NRRL Y-2460 TaxID=669874 RepID=A0A1E4TZZ7_PACTA|nr:hypothetical protein PACTADRAFT_66284 [Pachysolen tannophilus NRRL Y-2460]